MASLPNTKLVTYEEWLQMPEVSEGIEEVVNGEIQVLPAPKWKDATIIENLRDLMAPQIDRQLVRIAVSQSALVIRKRPLTTRVPDLAVFERSSIVERDGYIHSAPQLIVEVLSPANRREEREGKLARLRQHRSCRGKGDFAGGSDCRNPGFRRKRAAASHHGCGRRAEAGTLPIRRNRHCFHLGRLTWR
jgi:Uma2 family endonuclease